MEIYKPSYTLLKNIIFTIIVLISGFIINGQSIVVNSTNYKQTIDMVGGDMERSSKAIQNAQNKAEIINWGFGDIDFNYLKRTV